MNYNINAALAVASRRPSRRISRTYANEPVLFALVERGFAVWNGPLKGSVTVNEGTVRCWRREEERARQAALQFVEIKYPEKAVR